MLRHLIVIIGSKWAQTSFSRSRGFQNAQKSSIKGQFDGECCWVIFKIKTHGALDRLPKHVHPLGLDGDAQGLLELSVLEATGEHPVHDVLLPRVDLLGLGLAAALGRVRVDALG